MLNQLYADVEMIKQSKSVLEGLMAKANTDADKLEAGGMAVALSRVAGSLED